MREPYPWREAPSAAYAVLGDPIRHSLSPTMQGAALRFLGSADEYVAIHAPAVEFPAALNHLAELGYKGANVTVPHKEAAYEWASNPDETSLALHACNTLRFSDRRAINTDVDGFLDTLRPLGLRDGARILILGAGGSARAVAYGLVAGKYRVSIWNRTPARASALIQELKLDIAQVDDPIGDGFDLVINSTSSSLTGELPGVRWAKGNLAYDLAYGIGPTPFLIDAARHGIPGQDGRAMLVHQGLRALEWWRGSLPPGVREVMEAAIK